MGNLLVAWFGGLLIGLGIGMEVGATRADNEWRQITLERGLTQYCPTNGELEWKGECDE